MKNLDRLGGLVHSQRVLLALTQKGAPREDAYRLVQRNAMKAAGQSTEEFDHRLDAAVRRSLKYEKGLSGAEIDKRMGTFANPLDAAKALMKDDNKSGDVKDKAPGDKHSSIDLDDIRSKLKAAGVTPSDKPDADATPKHGVNVQKTAAKDGAAVGA